MKLKEESPYKPETKLLCVRPRFTFWIAHKIVHTALQGFTNIYKAPNSALQAAIHESI
jgi:hypothetical protein